MVAQRLRNRIIGKGRGYVFTPSDFLDLGARTAVDQALSRLSAQGTIRRLSQGLYDYPKSSSSLGLLSPSLDAIAEALARKDNHVLQVSPARAANMLGLTTQVPAKTVYFTDGPSRTRRIGRQTIQMKHASRKRLAGAGQLSGAVFQALRYVGRDGVDDQIIDKLRNALSPKDRKDLLKYSLTVPEWMRPIAHQIAAAA